ncbi:MAG TPA: YqgE/AlgH family protein [Actinomycetota bacterium]|nr:YqgE/AlgH family protein [Actinomycetota bacterium]
MQSLRGRVLISNGSLFDPNFRHTVVLVCEHSPDGALGLVLNRPSGVTVGEAVPPLSGAVDAEAEVFVGGPVQPNGVVLLAELDDTEGADVVVRERLGLLSGEVDEGTIAQIRRARVFAGYSGWGAAQLDTELANDDWIVTDATLDDVFSDEAEGLWARLLERKGGEFKLLARMPFDPSAN